MSRSRTVNRRVWTRTGGYVTVTVRYRDLTNDEAREKKLRNDDISRIKRRLEKYVDDGGDSVLKKQRRLRRKEDCEKLKELEIQREVFEEKLVEVEVTTYEGGVVCTYGGC